MAEAAAGQARRRALLIVNRRARAGVRALDDVMTILEEGGIDIVESELAGRDQVLAEICEDAANIDLVILGGGDGTLNAAAPALVQTGLPLGILPLGTANDLARTLGIPPDIDAAARIIAAGQTRTIDLGLVNDQPFFNVASLGLSAELALQLTQDIKRRWGRAGYALVALRVLARARPFTATITSRDGSVRVKTLQIAVGNGRYYGGGNAVEKDAAIDDQHLDLYSLEVSRAWKLALMARSFRYGEHGAWREVRAIRAKEFTIRTRRPRPINADGEIVTQTPAHFTIWPSAVTVFTP